METKADKVRQLLQNQPKTRAGTPTANLAQDMYQRKLSADIDRTKKFLEQANSAISRLETELQQPNTAWDDETATLAHTLALHEVSRRVPYTAMKNDLIGIATALSLTLKAVKEQAAVSDHYAAESREVADATQELKRLLADYKEADQLIQNRIKQHPERVAQLRAKIRESQTLEMELKLQALALLAAAQAAKVVEDKMHQHLKRIITKLYALLDWENASKMDEATFKRSISQSFSFVNLLVLQLSNHSSGEQWVRVEPGSAEEKLVQLMIRNNLVIFRDAGGIFEVRLREYGLL